LESLESRLQETRDTLASTHARLAQSASQDWQAVIDADRVRVARATRLQELRQALESVIAQREAKQQALAQVARALDELAQNLAAPPLHGVSVHTDDIRAQMGAWQSELRSRRRARGSPQAYDLATRRAQSWMQEIQEAQNELHSRRQRMVDAERAVSVAQERVEALKKKVFLYPECGFEKTEVSLDRAELLLQVAGQRLHSGGAGIAGQVTQSVRDVRLELDRTESQFAVSRQRLDRLRNGPRPADLERAVREIEALQLQAGPGRASPGGSGPSREHAETNLRVLLQTSKYPEPELGSLVQRAEVVRTYVDQQIAALTERARAQHKELASTLLRIRGYANGWHWTYRDRAWNRVSRQHREHQRLLSRVEDAKELAQKTDLLRQLVEQISATDKAAAELEQTGKALCADRDREQARLHKLVDLVDATAAGRRRDRAQGCLEEAQGHLKNAVQASSHVDAARAIEQMARALDRAEKALA
jgi:hypothetical protein